MQPFTLPFGFTHTQFKHSTSAPMTSSLSPIIHTHTHTHKGYDDIDQKEKRKKATERDVQTESMRGRTRLKENGMERKEGREMEKQMRE